MGIISDLFGWLLRRNPAPVTPISPPTVESTITDTLVALHNQFRQQNGFKPLQWHDGLSKAAGNHAVWMATHMSLSHGEIKNTQYYTGYTFVERVNAASGIILSGGGENIAQGQTTPGAVVESWIASPPHKANILAKEWTHVGFGRCSSDTGVVFWCAVFADFSLETGKCILKMQAGISDKLEASPFRLSGATVRTEKLDGK